jgi:hypothetical protein
MATKLPNEGARLDDMTELLRSYNVTSVTDDGTPVEVGREVFLSLSERLGAQLVNTGIRESEVLDDFATSRRR